MIRRLAVLLTAAALALPATPAHAEPVQREPASVTIATTGNGHGKGLSQYGARNRANEAGQTYRQIVEHYYPGTAWGSAGGSIRVLLTAAPKTSLVVLARSGLKARQVATGRTWTLPVKRDGRPVTRWRVKTVGNRSEVAYRTRAWHEWKTRAGTVELTAGRRPMTVVGASTYRGAVRLTPSGTVNVVGLEDYLRGVVASEVPATWPHAAVEAQAVAARTYAVFERGNVSSARAYDLCDTSACQVYKGAAGEHPGSDAAVAATAGKVLTYGGAPAFTQFSASNGGYSTAGDFPYLVAEWDEFDRGMPDDPRTRTFTGEEITRHWTGLGDLVSVEVTERDGDGVHQGHVTEVTVTGTLRTQVTTGSAFARFLGLRSTMFTVS